MNGEQPMIEKTTFNFDKNLIEKDELKKCARLNNRKYDEIGIVPKELVNYVGQGWALKREGLKSSRIVRDKGHEELLRDRFWMLLFKMGYPRLSGKPLPVEYSREDGSTGKKVISVIATDDETVFLAECFSSEKRDKISLRKELEKTKFLQSKIRNEVYKQFPKGKRPKIIWTYVTRNIIAYEADLTIAKQISVHFVTENELQYFETFVKHMGPAGRYQILAEFLEGQKIEGLRNIKIPAVTGKISGNIYYSFVATPRSLLKISFVNHQSLSTPEGDPAYQRMISSSRIKKIGEYIKSGGYFPTNILVNFVDGVQFNKMDNKDNTDPNITFGWLTLPSKYKSAWIIDGQHRLYGFSHLDDKLLDEPLFVLAFEKMSKDKEADLFITINHEQKSVPKSLLVSLLADLKMNDKDPKTALSALSSAVVRSINL